MCNFYTLTCPGVPGRIAPHGNGVQIERHCGDPNFNIYEHLEAYKLGELEEICDVCANTRPARERMSERANDRFHPYRRRFR